MVVILAALVVACGPLPRPFKPGMKDRDNPLLLPGESEGIVVAPVADAPPSFSGPLADMMAAALQRMDLPASTDGTLRRAYLLEGRMRLEDLERRSVDLVIAWRLSDRDGSPIGTWEFRERVPLGDWTTGVEPLLGRIVAESAPAIAALVRPPATSARPRARPRLRIGTISGAPGDGNKALAVAFRAVLRRAGLPLTDDPTRAAAELSGKVETRPAAAGKVRLTILWTLRDREGRTRATFRQGNEVRRDRIESRWGALAYDIATAMAEGLAAALARMETASAEHSGSPSARTFTVR